MRRRSNRSFLLALLVLAASVAAELQIAFVHDDDDGCVVEVHCLACRLILGGGAVAATITSNVAPAGQPADFVVPAATVAASSAVLETRRPRGPPSSTPQPITS